MGTSFGALVSFSVGGWGAQEFGWRQAYLVVGLPGIALAALIALAMREPQRGLSEMRRPAAKVSFVQTLRFMGFQPAVRNHTLAMALFIMAYVAILIWLAPFFVRTHDMTLAEIGPRLGLIFGLIGGAGSLIGGFLADKLTGSKLKRLPLFVGATYFACAQAALAGLFAFSAAFALSCFGV